MTDDTLSADRAEATPDELAKFHDGMEGASMVALWERHTNHRENFASSEPPHIWHWREVEPLIEQAVQVTDLEQSERRVIQMHNPAYAIENFCTTKNINCGLQIIMPGERARPHRHNINALRFALEGEGAVTVVDGKRCSMMRGDMILTPGWTWHEHVHEGDEHEGDERVVWLDCLDSPVIDYLGVRFFEPGPAKDFPVLAPDSTFNAPGFAPECEIGDLPYSPMFRYSWAAASQAFDAMPAAADGSRRLHYTNPVTGGAVMTLLDCYLIRLGKNQPTVPLPHHRQRGLYGRRRRGRHRCGRDAPSLGAQRSLHAAALELGQAPGVDVRCHAFHDHRPRGVGPSGHAARGDRRIAGGRLPGAASAENTLIPQG